MPFFKVFTLKFINLHLIVSYMLLSELREFNFKLLRDFRVLRGSKSILLKKLSTKFC